VKELSSDELLLSTVTLVSRGIVMDGRHHITYTIKLLFMLIVVKCESGIKCF